MSDSSHLRPHTPLAAKALAGSPALQNPRSGLPRGGDFLGLPGAPVLGVYAFGLLLLAGGLLLSPGVPAPSLPLLPAGSDLPQHSPAGSRRPPFLPLPPAPGSAPIIPANPRAPWDSPCRCLCRPGASRLRSRCPLLPGRRSRQRGSAPGACWLPGLQLAHGIVFAPRVPPRLAPLPPTRQALGRRLFENCSLLGYVSLTSSRPRYNTPCYYLIWFFCSQCFF